jgi:hypothetical protein
MRQPLLFASDQSNFAAAPTASYGDILGNFAAAWSTTENRMRSTVAAPGVLKELFIELQTAPGVGASRDFTVMHNGVASAITLTISGAASSASATGLTLTVAAGDVISLRQVATGAAVGATGIRGSWVFEPTDGVTTIYGSSHNISFAGAAAVEYQGALFGTNTWVTVANNAMNIVSAAGTIDSIYINASAAPGGTAGLTYYLRKNGVRQDGTGGTVNTQIVATGAATAWNRTGIGLSIALGDQLLVEVVGAAGGSGSRYWADGGRDGDVRHGRRGRVHHVRRDGLHIAG